MDHATLVVSGTKIADEIGTSRSEVWRLIQQLRASGLEIAGHPATGYRLQKVPDLLLPDSLSPLIRGTIFSNRIHHYFRIASTNAAAMEAAAAGEPEGAVFVAEQLRLGLRQRKITPANRPQLRVRPRDRVMHAADLVTDDGAPGRVEPRKGTQ